MVLLTYGRSDSQGDAVPALLDEVDDVAVVEGVDVHVVHCEDPVPHLQTAATFRRRTWNVFCCFQGGWEFGICRIQLSFFSIF